MKISLAFMSLLFFVLTATGQRRTDKQALPDSAKKTITVEAACGECQLGMQGKNCDLAVRIDRKSFFVDGVDIDSQGDAHAKDGFCKTIRKAEVQGEIVDNRFKATYFRLISNKEPADSSSKKKN